MCQVSSSEKLKIYEKKITYVGYQCYFWNQTSASQNVAAPQSHLLKKHEMNINSVLLSCEKNKTM